MSNTKLVTGTTASFSKIITEQDIDDFAKVTGDYNCVHMDEKEAENSIFGQRIAHGMLAGSLISAVLGTKLPGPGTIYLEQTCKFKAPVYIGDRCTAIVVLTDVLNEEKNIYRLDTKVVRQDGITAVEGYAVVMYKS